MAKELIFMGRQAGKVRLALFDSSHGTARKLPFKEVTEDVFAAGIKNGSLPVRGFGVTKGRITCKYGDWYKLPNVEDTEALSLFGIVHLGAVTLDESGKIPNVPHDYYDAKQVKFYGIACVEWSTGMFRVMAPGTYFHMVSNTKVMMYTYDGPITNKRLQPKDINVESFGEGVDYTFEECDSTETMSEISTWLRIYDKSAYVYFQWLYQRCESFASSDSNMSTVKAYLTSSYTAGAPELVQLGKRPLDLLEVPQNVLHIAILQGRKVDVVMVKSTYSIYLKGFNDVTIECENLTDLSMSIGTRARLIRKEESPLLAVYGWDGFAGSGGDYTGYNLRGLSSCFTTQPDVNTLIFDVEHVRGSFIDMANVIVEFTKPLRSVYNSFRNFKGTLNVDGMVNIDYSFDNCTLTNTLDLRQTEYLSRAVKDYKGKLILPEFFKMVSGDVFKGTDITQIKVCPDTVDYAYLGRSITVDNSDLTVEVQCVNKKTQLDFEYGEFRDLFYSAPQGSRVPKFTNTSMFPSQSVFGVAELADTAFKEVNRGTLDFSLFPDVAVIPENTAVRCKFSTIIFGPKVTRVATKAFVDCDSIRWVYIPSTVTDLGVFIQRPRIAYTIFTQKGSAADKFAKKYAIEVKYTDTESEFKKIIEEVPEEMEGAVVVAILAGTGDGVEAAVKMACESVDVSSDIESSYVFQEKTDIWAADVDIIKDRYADKLRNYCVFKPRLHIAMAQLSNSADYNPDVVKAKVDHITLSSQIWYRSGIYSMVCSVLRTTSKTADILWLVLKDNTVINAFTEHVSSIYSNCSIRAQLAQAFDSDYVEANPTNISSLITHMNFTNQGVSVRGKGISYSVGDMVYNALRKTYVPIGFYKSKTGARTFITVDISNLNLVAFKLSSGILLDDGKQKETNRAANMWTVAQNAIGGAQFLDSLYGWTRMYSIVGDGDAMLSSLVGTDLVKCDDYDYSVPTVEIEAIRIIRKALSGYSPVSETDLKTALKTCGLVRPLSAGGWAQVKKKASFNGVDKHSNFQFVQGYSANVSWFVFGYDLDGTGGVYTLALTNDVEEMLRSIVDLYDSIDSRASWREDHYALVTAMLPSDEFLIVREFNSGGTYTSYGSFEPVIAVSRISGKIAVASRVKDKIIPIFWVNSFAAALRILEVCGITAFSHKQEWLYKKHDSITTGIFKDKASYTAGVPDFSSYAWRLRDTREAIRRGECDGYVCPSGEQEIFDLALKNPTTSDYIMKDEV